MPLTRLPWPAEPAPFPVPKVSRETEMLALFWIVRRAMAVSPLDIAEQQLAVIAAAISGIFEDFDHREDAKLAATIWLKASAPIFAETMARLAKISGE